MIPKKIHYCWFGGNPLPESALKCIESWKTFLPDYEIVQWDESNFDVGMIKYTADAYAMKKYAFVSDYARMWVMYHHGGVYFDTDVELIRPIDDILERGGYLGFETSEFVNPGLGMALPKGSRIAANVMERFAKTDFLNPDGSFNPQGIVPITTGVLVEMGLQRNGTEQTLPEATVYPADRFNPLDPATGRLTKTANTRSIHWYTKSWMEPQSRFRTFLSQWSHRLFGTSLPGRIKKLIGR